MLHSTGHESRSQVASDPKVMTTGGRVELPDIFGEADGTSHCSTVKRERLAQLEEKKAEHRRGTDRQMYELCQGLQGWGG